MIDIPLAVTYADISSAADTLEGIAHRTPVMTSRQANEKTKAQLFFKCENFQRVGAFKFRGAYNAISRLSDDQRRRGIIAYSSGNHAQAVALAARLLGARASIVMPQDAPAIKVAATRGYGAEIIFYDRKTQRREEIAAALLHEQRLTLIPPFDHPHVMAGQGTVAKELIEESGPLDYLFTPVGGGGLLAGCAIAAKHLSPNCIVIGVEPETGTDAQQSLRSGKIVEIPVPDTIADGAQTQRIGQLVFPILQGYVKDIVSVNDEQLRAQMRFFAERMKMVVEPTGCLAAAYVMNHAIDFAGKRVGIIVSGGNVDPILFGQSINL